MARENMTQNDMVIDDHQISTWLNDDVDMPCIAVNMSEAAKVLEGYELTDQEKTEIPYLMAGYCRLIEECGLVGFGETELEAINDLFSHATKVENAIVELFSK